MRLGELISTLEGMEPDLALRVQGRGYATALDSYRGYYDQLALGWSDKSRTVGDALADARAAVGKVFQGYKGGDYEMSEHTAVWVAQCGDVTDLGIASIFRGHGEATVITMDVGDYGVW